jgi:pyrroloquinoline quinone (PQQ) biosynthesis protein C|tara:strand:+ start:1185 stop:1466 length:282 start_codon:yes stop_codon:yes gene_type:complete
MKDVRGYSVYTLRKNEAAPINMIGVQLGKVCIANDITIQKLSKYFGVSRWNLYAWFYGDWNPHKKHHEKALKIIETGKLDCEDDKDIGENPSK